MKLNGSFSSIDHGLVIGRQVSLFICVMVCGWQLAENGITYLAGEVRKQLVLVK